MNKVFIVANKEFHDGLRNRWFVSITLIFAVLSLGLSYYGTVVSGSIGVASLSSTIASLASLAVFLIPLIALLVSYDSFVGEQESGTLLLLLTYPISKTQLLIGKFVGQGGIIALATLLGFGTSAALLSYQQGIENVAPAFTLFISSAILLGLSFTALAYLISLLVNEKSKAAGLALVLWFFFALVFDLALLAVLVGTEDVISQHGLTYIMLLNPADVFRLVNFAALDATDVNGVLAMTIQTSASPAQLFVTLLLWVIMPLTIANFIFKKSKI
ncbi:ABC transporter permease [Thalassotalea sp. M1531]|uniref:ABC transporter permease n=1 Tax=Thalassotalea algicola TaxID=2716224 RepID=A0A7Y0LBZ9_9GAMM|nr:ABC transporter permease subunit [Thalassotalea algicola]NMP31646.1 ABC transporter permease [Thalassotalea algicola]